MMDIGDSDIIHEMIRRGYIPKITVIMQSSCCDGLGGEQMQNKEEQDGYRCTDQKCNKGRMPAGGL